MSKAPPSLVSSYNSVPLGNSNNINVIYEDKEQNKTPTRFYYNHGDKPSQAAPI